MLARSGNLYWHYLPVVYLLPEKMERQSRGAMSAMVTFGWASLLTRWPSTACLLCLGGTGVLFFFCGVGSIRIQMAILG